MSRGKYVDGQECDVEIERLVAGGAGLARGPEGVLFVDGAAPGDVATVVVESIRGGIARGRIARILHGGPGRIDPPCRWYGRCGGCDLQHLDYQYQIAAKVDIVTDALQRIGGIDLERPIVVHPAPQPFGSRVRIELHADPNASSVGFFVRRSREIVPIDRCIVCNPEVDYALQSVSKERDSIPQSLQLLGANGTVRSAPPHPPLEGSPFWIRIGALEYLADPAAFFQSSLELLPAMIDTVLDSAGSDRTLALDLFSGAGLFSLPLAQRFERVTGVDNDARAIRNAGLAAKRNGIGNAKFATADVRAWLGNNRRSNLRPALVVADPPRTGLQEELSQLLLDREVARLTYVSCDPATLARDLRILTSGRLAIREIAIFDLFPQTHHVETIVQLVADQLTTASPVQ